MRILFYCCVSFFFVACFEPVKTEKPIIEGELFVKLLADIQLAEIVISESFAGGNRDSIASVYYQQVFEIYGVTKEDFSQSMDAYLGNPTEADLLFQKVKKQLVEEQIKQRGNAKDIKKAGQDRFPKNDSIKNKKGNLVKTNLLKLNERQIKELENQAAKFKDQK